MWDEKGRDNRIREGKNRDRKNSREVDNSTQRLLQKLDDDTEKAKSTPQNGTFSKLHEPTPSATPNATLGTAEATAAADEEEEDDDDGDDEEDDEDDDGDDEEDDEADDGDEEDGDEANGEEEDADDVGDT